MLYKSIFIIIIIIILLLTMSSLEVQKTICLKSPQIINKQSSTKTHLSNIVHSPFESLDLSTYKVGMISLLVMREWPAHL